MAKDFEVKLGPAEIGYRQHDGYVVLLVGAYRKPDGTLTRQRSLGKLAYDVFFELPNHIAEAEGIRPKPEAKK